MKGSWSRTTPKAVKAFGVALRLTQQRTSRLNTRSTRFKGPPRLASFSFVRDAEGWDGFVVMRDHQFMRSSRS
jgi:hypothetical protein